MAYMPSWSFIWRRSAAGLPVYGTSCAAWASVRLECATSWNHATRYKNQKRLRSVLRFCLKRKCSVHSFLQTLWIPPDEVQFGSQYCAEKQIWSIIHYILVFYRTNSVIWMINLFLGSSSGGTWSGPSMVLEWIWPNIRLKKKSSRTGQCKEQNCH